MRYAMPKARMRLFLPLLMLPAVSACVSAPPIVASQSACSSLLPSEWKSGVAGAPLPSGNSAGDWIAFADAQTGQLDKANDRYVAGVGIIERCEARDRDAVKKTRRKFFGLF